MESASTLLISIVLSHFAGIMTGIAVFSAVISTTWFKGDRQCSDIFLSRLMLFSVGLSGLWIFIFFVFFPNISAAYIGWTPSPFQFEVAVANLGLGVAGIVGVSASRDYRIATTIFTTCFLWGAAAGHIRQMIIAHNFAPGNAGMILYNDLIVPLLLIVFLYCQKCCDKKNQIN